MGAGATIDLEKFFSVVRAQISGGHLTQTQVSGFEFLLSKIEQAHIDPRWAAYMLATAWHETGGKMTPVKEWGNGDGPDSDTWDDYLEKYDTGKLAAALGNSPEADGDGVKYCGRGYVQITGANNYKRFSRLLGVDLVGYPDLAMAPENAWSIMFIGMTQGIFTGKKLADYFNSGKTDWLNARRIINGMDCAAKVAGYAQKFFAAI